MRALLFAVLVALAPALALGAAGPSRYRAYVPGPWGQIHVRVDGDVSDGRPTVILLHKMVWSSVQFEKVQPLLARAGVRTIAVDIPGYGLSDGPPSEPTAEAFADALLPVLDHFRLARADMLGSDSGATIMAAFADRHPDRTVHLIMDGPPIFDAAARAKLLEEPEFDRSPQPDGSQFSRRWDMIAKAAPGAALSTEARHVGEMQFFQAAPTYLYGHHAIFKYDLAPTVKRLKVPVLLLDSRGSQLHQTAVDVKTRVRPDFDYVELGWPGIMASYDDPQPWAAAVADYVKRTRR